MSGGAEDLDAEVDSFIGGVNADSSGSRSRRRKATRATREPEIEPEIETAAEVHAEVGDEEEPEPKDLLPRELPRPVDSQKTLASMLSKYGIGTTPDFKIQLHRLMPKFFPGTGTQAHGYIEEFVDSITEQFIAAEYGGGTYQVRVLGPDPNGSPNGSKQYDSIKIELAGPPNADRLARSVRAKLDAAAATSNTGPAVGPPMTQAPQENPGLATQALKMVQDVADREREERRRSEDKASTGLEAVRDMYRPVLEAESRRADELVKAEREKSTMERNHLEQRLQESRDETRRLAEKVESMSNNGVSIAAELKEIIPMFGNRGDNGAAAAEATAKSSEAITKSILDRHQTEIESIHKQHQTMLETMRTSHMNEISAMRDSHARQLEAERESGKHREQRHEEQLKTEREERRRDAEAYKRNSDARDDQWKERLENAEINLKTMWESRLETTRSNFEARIQWMQSEIEQLQTRNRELQAGQAGQGDILTQLSRVREVRAVAKDALGIDDSPAPSPSGGGGIGLSGLGGEGSGSMGSIIETALENIGPILQTLGYGPGGQQQAPQQQAPQQQVQHAPGTVLNTPQGPMVVIETPQGLALTPKDQYDAFQAQQRQQRTSRQQPAPGRQRGILGQQPARPSDGIPVPNMAEGLPLKPRPWGQSVQPPMPQDAPPQAPQQRQAAPQQRQVQQQPAPQARPQQGGSMDATQKFVANEVAKMIHNSVENGEEPEEFVAAVLEKKFPDQVVKGIASMSGEQVIAAIKEVQPNSAGATPMGQRFVHAALAALRATV